MTVSQLHAELAARRLLSESQMLPADPAFESSASPWFVQVVIGFSAWLAGIFLLGFIGMVLESMHLRSSDFGVMFLVLGVCCVTAAAIMYAFAGPRNLFAAQFALAVSCAGQLGIGFGLGEAGGAPAVFWGMLVVEIILAAIMKNRLHRFLSSLAAVIAWALAMRDLLLHDLRGVEVQAPHELASVILWAIVWGPVAAAACVLAAREAEWMARGLDAVLRPITQGLVAGLSAGTLALFPPLFWIEIGFGSPGNAQAASGWVALWPLFAALLALLAMALAFTLGDRALLGFAILFALLDIGCFYYLLGTTLLVKSILMIVLGGVLLGAARLLERAES